MKLYRKPAPFTVCNTVLSGHLLFEMCCGYELTTVSPRKQEYKSVKDKLLKATLRYIFEEGFPHSVEEVRLLSENRFSCYNL